MNKIVMLRLRNRTLNRFKQAKPTTAAKLRKPISKKISISKRGKTLRVVPKPVISNKSNDQKQTKTFTLAVRPILSPKSCKDFTSFIATRRIFLRNRRLMHLGSPKAICAF